MFFILKTQHAIKVTKWFIFTIKFMWLLALMASVHLLYTYEKSIVFPEAVEDITVRDITFALRRL